MDCRFHDREIRPTSTDAIRSCGTIILYDNISGNGEYSRSKVQYGCSPTMQTRIGGKGPGIVAALFLFIFNTFFAVGWLGMTWLYPAEVSAAV